MRGVCAFLFGAILSAAQTDSGLPPELLLLAKVKLHAAETLDRLPNYTCLETIERSARTLPAKKYRLSDTLRLEVALVDGAEIFAWPGAKKFETTDLRDMVPQGAVSNGDFALFAKAVFQTSAPTYTYRGEDTIEGAAVFKWDFRVHVMSSGYHLKIGNQEGMAGFHGSFWVLAKNLDLLRLEFEADDIPINLDLSRTFSRMDYVRRKIGDGDFLLPLASDLTLVDLRGNEKRNRALFSDCRQYVGESILRFDDGPTPEASAPVKLLPLVELPPKLELLTTIESLIDLTTVGIGDPVRAILSENAKIKRKTIVPKGAVLSGRVVEVQRTAGVPFVTLQFTALEWPESRSVFTAQFDLAAMPPAGTAAIKRTGGDALSPALRPGGVRLSSTSTSKIGPGLVVYWRTDAAAASK